jgi:pyridoxal/pyridoxine/pyridoxamine kinase
MRQVLGLDVDAINSVHFSNHTGMWLLSTTTPHRDQDIQNGLGRSYQETIF